ncbi:MAG: MFS transporter [Lachnospiraceae bacterium]|nr:MFS transporter [Lachnospiraceae bacterium]
MEKNEIKLLASRAVNRIGNVMYDYGNSTWIAGLGGIGKKYLGYYQLAENLISLFLNPIGGAVADRFKRRKILLTTDLIGGIMCSLLALIGNEKIMLWGLIAVNAALAIMHAFSGTSFKSYVVTVVSEDRLVKFNANLEMISQIISVSSPLLAFLFVDRFGLRPTLAIDAITFFLSFFFIFLIREDEKHVEKGKGKTAGSLLKDIKDGMLFVLHQKEIFFLLAVAALVNSFIAAFNYLVPFSNSLFDNSASYATLLSLGAAGSIAGAFLASKLFKNSYRSILIALALCGAGLMYISICAVFSLPYFVIVFGNFFFEFFLTIFNIHFFSMVQKKVPNELLGRVFSSIFTVAVIFMPLSTALMTALPFAVNVYSFGVIGAGILLVSFGGFICSRNF